MKLLWLFFTVLMGCACSTTKSMQLTAPAQIEPIVQRFVADCRKSLPENVCSPPIKLYISINTITEDGVLGQCTTYREPFDDIKFIEIQPNVVNSYQLWAVMYHELFHCVLNKPHYDTEYDIMNAYESPDVTRILYSDWDFFVQRVFQRE